MDNIVVTRVVAAAAVSKSKMKEGEQRKLYVNYNLRKDILTDFTFVTMLYNIYNYNSGLIML